jgi:hypothetical protein
MASNPVLRNGTQPSRPTSTPTNANLSLAEQGARLLAQRAANKVDERRIRIILPRHLYVEPADMEKYLNDDPLVGTRGAAIILGLSYDLLRKWRQREKGPEYYQYEKGGPVLYSVRALSAFKAAHLVIPGKRGRK